MIHREEKGYVRLVIALNLVLVLLSACGQQKKISTERSIAQVPQSNFGDALPDFELDEEDPEPEAVPAASNGIELEQTWEELIKFLNEILVETSVFGEALTNLSRLVATNQVRIERLEKRPPPVFPEPAKRICVTQPRVTVTPGQSVDCPRDLPVAQSCHVGLYPSGQQFCDSQLETTDQGGRCTMTGGCHHFPEGQAYKMNLVCCNI